MRMRKKPCWVLGAFFFLNSPLVFAAQDGRITADLAEVHQYPNETSPVLGSIQKDVSVKLSNQLVRDVHGVYWYKVRVPQSGGLGYLRAKEVKALQLDRSLRQAGIDE